jgi:predicted restriction endonuclease
VERLSRLLGVIAEGTPDPPEPRVPSTIRRRRGQAKFRRALLARFGNTCCISGSRLTSLLEAAHIRTQKESDDNRPSNGLLLRADFHTLYDLGQIAVNPATHRIALHPALLESEYAEFEGKSLIAPDRVLESLDVDALKDRWVSFTKFRGSA